MIPPSPMDNPPGQVMDRDNDYDPQRIPSSVFEPSNPSAPADWSIGSNESLFSIQVGGASLSREQSLYLSGELERLTQLCKEGQLSPAELRDLRKLAGLNKSLELSGKRLHQPSTIPEGECEIGNEIQEENNLEEQNEKEKEKEIEVPKEKLVLDKKIGESHKHTASTHSSNPSRPSDVSVQSTYSFNFPILGQTEKSAPISGRSGQTWEEAKTSLVTPEPATVKKRRCFYCFSCNCCPFSCPESCHLPWPRCLSCSRCFTCCSFSLCKSCSCACFPWKACFCLKCCQPK